MTDTNGPREPVDGPDLFGFDVPAARSPASGRRAALKGLLMDEVRRQPPWWRRSRRSTAIGAGAAALVLVGGAASAYVAFQPASDLTTVQCYASADPGGQHAAPEIAIVEPAEDSRPEQGGDPVPITDPVRACEQLWEIGVLQPDSESLHQPASPDVPRRAAPDLVACTLATGTAGVFPGGSGTCERLGLPETVTR